MSRSLYVSGVGIEIKFSFLTYLTELVVSEFNQYKYRFNSLKIRKVQRLSNIELLNFSFKTVFFYLSGRLIKKTKVKCVKITRLNFSLITKRASVYV